MGLSANPLDNPYSFSEWTVADEPVMGFESEALAQAEQVHEFLLRTPGLTASEQAELLGSVVENAPSAGGKAPTMPAYDRRAGGSTPTRRASDRPSGTQPPARGRSERGAKSTDFSALARRVQQGLNLFQTGAQIAGGLAGTFGGNDRTAQDFALWANRLGQGAGQLDRLVQDLRSGQIPALPGVAGGGVVGLGGLQLSPPPQLSPGAPPAGYTAPAVPAGVPGGPPVNATALMALLLNNPQLIQAIQSAPFLTQAGAPGVQVNIPNSAPVSIPLPDAMNTVAQLAQASARELSAMTSEDDPEVPDYLLAEDGDVIVDPVSAEDRAALVLHLLRIEGEARRCAESDGFLASDGMGMDEMDESDVWAREAGF